MEDWIIPTELHLQIKSLLSLLLLLKKLGSGGGPGLRTDSMTASMRSFE